MIKVSVITTVYNGEKHLESCINSIKNQTYTEFEYLILNDGSTDKTQEILDSICDPRIRVVNVGKIGRAKGLNELLKLAQGQYIANLDADDKVTEDRLSRQVEVLENMPNVVLVGSGTIIINDKDEVIGESESTEVSVLNKLLGKNCPINHSSVMYRKEVAVAAGMYDESLNKQIDYEFWIRMSKEGKLINIPDKLTYKRLHDFQNFEKGGLKYQLHAIKIQKKAIKELKLSKINYIYVVLRYIYYMCRLDLILTRKTIIKVKSVIGIK